MVFSVLWSWLQYTHICIHSQLASDLKGPSNVILLNPSPCHLQLFQGVQGHIKSDLECIQGQGLNRIRGHSIPVLSHSHCKELPPKQQRLPVFNLSYGLLPMEGLKIHPMLGPYNVLCCSGFLPAAWHQMVY